MKTTSLLLILIFSLLVACACVNQFVQLPSEISFSTEISSSLHNEFEKIEVEASSLIDADSSDEQWINAQHSFFLIVGNRIKAWSKNDFKPDLQTIADDFSIRLKQNQEGKFIERKWKKDNNSYLLVVLPLEYTYDIVNDFLRPFKSSLLPYHSDILPHDSPNGACVELMNSRCLFKIKASKIDLFQGSAKAMMIFVCLIGLLILIVSLIFHQMLLNVKKKRPEILFLLSLIIFFSVRIAMVKFNLPSVFFTHKLFDPAHYASSSYNVSIADLLINSVVVFFLALLLFITFKRFSFIRKVNRLNKLFRLLLSGAFVFVLYLSFLFPYLYVESIYHNSSISLEITDSLSFDSFRITAFISILFGCITSYLMIRMFLRLVLFVNGSSTCSFLPSYFLGSLFFVIFFFLDEKDYWIPLSIGLVFMPIIFFSKASYRNTGISFRAYAYLLLIILAFSLECALSALKFHEEKQRESQFKFGSNYLVDQDILAEFLLNEASKSIASDEEIKNDIYTTQREEQVRQRITQYYLTSYFDRYEVSLAIFANDSVSKYRSKLNELINDRYATSFPNVYFINDPASDTLKRYISLIPFKLEKENLFKYVAVDLSLKKIIPETVFPELMVDKRYGQSFKDEKFSYALFNNASIHSSFGDFNYEKFFKDEWLGQIDLYNEGIVSDGFRHVAIEYQPHRIAVVSAPVYSIDYVVINFSFYIALGLSVILVLLITFALISGIKGKRLGYSSRIQLYVYLAFFIPLLIVSIVILRLIIISAGNQKEADYLLKAKILEERIAPIMDNYRNQGEEYKNELEAKLIEMAEVANLDATVFSMNGEVIASSEPLIFENKLLSGLVNREAWHSLLMNHETQRVQSEFIGILSYKSVYLAVKSPITAKVTAILSIPFFESAYSLERTEINVVSAILGVFSIAFILFSLLSYFAINGLTAPLKFITRALRTISLSGRNLPINWKGNDEIGAMTQEYNRMLVNLEESKKELQKSQKEIAWREVAQQVAHEIKNPLTPMKLSLQQLELALLKKEVDFDKGKNSVRVVLEQIDILNDIASSFRSFATLPPLNIKPINLTDILHQTIQLYSHHTEVDFNYVEVVDCIVLCDEAILSRAISNIVLNSIQATAPNKRTDLVIKIKRNIYDCVLSIKDNGCGITEALKDKIFKPHFTTKAAGSGLGLAIVKQTLELCNCSIWFDTEVGLGTTFYIQLPLHE